MAREHEQGQAEAVDDRSEYGDVLDGIDLRAFVAELINDVRMMRSGKITVHKARAIADLSKQALRGIHLMLEGAKYLEQKSTPIGKGSTRELIEGVRAEK